MPTFRIVYVEDETFAPRTLTAAFPDRAAAEITMARHGHRIVQIAEVGHRESVADPIRIAVVAEKRDAANQAAKRTAPKWYGFLRLIFRAM